MTRIEGFPPLLGKAPRVLILGSMPSVTSLDKQQYYGKAQNAFWKIMGELFSAAPELDYTERCRRLTDAGIAVWDVLSACVRPGSLDSAIDMQSAEVNDFRGLLTREAGINHVFFNGRKSEQIFMRRVRVDIDQFRPGIIYECLPSTSPAMATLNFEQKLSAWKSVLWAADNSGAGHIHA